MIVDERIKYAISAFFPTKGGMVEPTCELFQKLKDKGMPVKIVRCDNGGENLKLEERCNNVDWKLSVKFEYTGRATSQRNHLAELTIFHIGSRGRAIMKAANLPENAKRLLYREAFKIATYLNNLRVESIDGVETTRYEHYLGKKPGFTKYLHAWGEAGTVKVKGKNHPKLADRGTTCIFVGYELKSGDDMFRMYNPNTKRILITRDVIWLRHMYFNRFEPAENRFYHTSIDATKVKEGDDINDINETSDANNEEMIINIEENRNEKPTDRNKSVVLMWRELVNMKQSQKKQIMK